MDFRDFIKNTKIVGLSPMDGITDEPFRLTQCHVAKPDVLFTEFVSAEGIAHGAVKLFDQLLFSSLERPVIGQLFGKDPDSFYSAAVILCYLGFDGIDINMGCPAKTVTQHGSGAALIEKPALASDIIKAVKSAIEDYSTGKIKLSNLKLKAKTLAVIDRNTKYSQASRPVKGGVGGGLRPTLSIKTRLAISNSTIDSSIPHLLKLKPDFITLHGRTLKQGYAGVADWSEIQKAAVMIRGSGVLLWGNGDIQTRKQGIEVCQKYSVDGVLIGRAALGNPWVFADKTANFKERFTAMKFHAASFNKVFPTRRFDPLRRDLLAYTKSHPHAKELRQKIVTLTNIDQLCAIEPEFLAC